MSRVDPSLVSPVVVELVRDAIAPTPVGWQVAPTPDDDEQENFDRLIQGYLVMSRVPGGANLSPGFTDTPDNVKSLRFALSGYGVQADQAELIAHAAADALLAGDSSSWTFPLDIPGHECIRRIPSSDGFTDRVGPTHSATSLVDLWVAAL